jgi:manganese/zinc/iron transport system permease protein
MTQSRSCSDIIPHGVVFPLFFSLGIILITRFADDIHLDTDSVLMGELAFAPFRRLFIGEIDIGPASLWSMLAILFINLIFVVLFYKELKVATFDPLFADSIGISPTLIHYALMTLVSLTAVGAYDTVGSILVVGFMVGPALTGYLLTNDLKKMLGIAVLAAVFNSIIGVALGFYLDVSLAGMIATVTGLTAFITFLLSPKKGWLSKRVERNKQKNDFKEWLSSK